MLTFIIWAGILSALIYYIAIRPMNYWKDRGVPYTKPIWLFGDNLWVFFKQECFFRLLRRQYKEHGDKRYFGGYQFTVPMLYVNDPELIKQITVKDFDHFVDHQGFSPEKADPLFSNNLFSLKGQKWREVRPILSPSFTSSKMRTMFLLIEGSVKNFVDNFVKKESEVTEVAMKRAFTRLATDVIATTAFGIQVDSIADPENEFYRMGSRIANFGSFKLMLKFVLLIMAPKLCDMIGMTILGKDVNDYFYNLINETVKTREEKNIMRPDMIHLLMEARKGTSKAEEHEVIDTGFATVQEIDIGKPQAVKKGRITTMDIAANALIFFIAGFDTVTTAMSFLVYELAVNTDIQDKLRKEIVEANKACNGELTYEVLMKLKYLDMVISETLRKWPPTGGLNRVCTKPYTIEPTRPDEKPLLVEKGTVLMLPAIGIHYDTRYYPEPEKFIPERFSEENRDKINPYLYMPFGLGPRNCIGSRFALLEMKTLLYYLLLQLEIVPTDKTPIPIKLENGFQVGIKDGCVLGLKRIKG